MCENKKIKLIIDVDEKLVCKGFEQPFTEEERNILIRAIGNGTPYKERQTGEWIPHYLDNLLWGQNECPFCHKRSNRGANFCQYCGVHLTEPKEDK